MELRIFTEPQQGADYGGCSRWPGPATAGLRRLLPVRPLHEHGGRRRAARPDRRVADLAGVALQTSRIKLGTLVSPTTFRYPGPLAISVAQVDDMSGGRVELGIGAGWYQAEHAAYAIPFPDTAERFDRLEEQLAIITGLWDVPVGERFSFAGKFYSVTDSPGLPKPVQRPHPPILIGGKGPRRTPQLAARYADEYNVPFSSVEDTAAAFGRVREACQAAGRDPGSLVYSAARTVCCGRDEAELARRARGDRLRPGVPARRGAGRHPGRDRGPDRDVRRARRHPDVPPGARPARPGSPGADRVRGPAPGPLTTGRAGRARRSAPRSELGAALASGRPRWPRSPGAIPVGLVAGDQGRVDTQPAGQRQRDGQHGRGVPAPPGRGFHVVADVPAELGEPGGEPVPDGEPPQVLVAVHPPQGGRGHVPGPAGRVLPGLVPQVAA